MKFETGKPSYPAFPWGDRLAVRVGGTDFLACVIAWPDMEALHKPIPDKTTVVGIPVYVAQCPKTSDVWVYPTPDRDYEVARVIEAG